MNSVVQCRGLPANGAFIIVQEIFLALEVSHNLQPLTEITIDYAIGPNLFDAGTCGTRSRLYL